MAILSVSDLTMTPVGLSSLEPFGFLYGFWSTFLLSCSGSSSIISFSSSWLNGQYPGFLSSQSLIVIPNKAQGRLPPIQISCSSSQLVVFMYSFTVGTLVFLHANSISFVCSLRQSSEAIYSDTPSMIEDIVRCGHFANFSTNVLL